MLRNIIRFMVKIQETLTVRGFDLVSIQRKHNKTASIFYWYFGGFGIIVRAEYFIFRFKNK